MRRIFALMLALALFTAPGFAGECGPSALADKVRGHGLPVARVDDSAIMKETLEPLALGFSEIARAHRTAARGAAGFRLEGERYRDFDCPGDMPTCTL